MEDPKFRLKKAFLRAYEEERFQIAFTNDATRDEFYYHNNRSNVWREAAIMAGATEEDLLKAVNRALDRKAEHEKKFSTINH